ncbi:MAG: HNH endonuclease [Candidatus Marinimicrobia bacterium]|mgnify:FL=1|jgi:5-methylcytosine-specific restriction endonuclease McrA|nr:HNH endonuclease [Candidatus Neomarinimicrobiota bacterium]MBT4068919.1 HNH endonuclease [Candidatus Neomarinimicrobiota bacterium]MBT6418195.1 HNH endonuclease [Candidatus Neomarinimicrobiota bacterium]MBT6841350.1 HNH endonuclease [Candidatus Neomarinimicrobiota bacterium]
MISPTINGSILNRSVLVLNTNYSPMDICTARHAICLFYNEKVEILESYNESVHSPSVTLSLPSIVKLKDFVRHHKMDVVLSRKNLLIRDKHQCQYCLIKKGPLTLDHVMPKNKGGGDSWENLVTACQVCNRKKGNRTPFEAKMPLKRMPKKPNKIHHFQQFIQDKQTAWRPYLFMESF